jgi:uncharacterized protein YebE (UPF0316 family)
MDATVAINCALIVVARVTDVSLGTVRTVNVIQGRRVLAAAVGFLEVLIWVLAVSKVVRELDNPFYAVSYAAGFGLGNFIGMLVESRIALGNQVVRVFTRRGAEVARSVREAGFIATEFQGAGRDGAVTLLFVQTRRRDAQRVAALARTIDPECFYTVDDTRFASAAVQLHQPTGWRAILKKK